MINPPPEHRTEKQTWNFGTNVAKTNTYDIKLDS